MLTKEMQDIQEILAHPGWKIFQDLLLGPDKEGRQSLRTQINNSLIASGRSGDTVKSAKFAGQLDILPVVLEFPEKYFENNR